VYAKNRVFKIPNHRGNLDDNMLMPLVVIIPVLIWNEVIDKYFQRDIMK